jgi:hypothetical protein
MTRAGSSVSLLETNHCCILQLSHVMPQIMHLNVNPQAQFIQRLFCVYHNHGIMSLEVSIM